MLKSTPEVARLRCPTCRDQTGSSAIVWVDWTSVDGAEVLDGTLGCARCGATYPVSGGVAVVVRDVDAFLAADHEDPHLPTYLWADYGQRYAPEVPAGIRPQPPAVELLLPRVAEGGRAIELGCGTGAGTFALAARADFALGIDKNRERVRAAVELRRTGRLDAPLRRLGERVERRDLHAPDLRGRPCDFLVADALDPPVSGPDWDAVLLANVYDVVRDPALLLGQTGALLHPGGYVLVATPYQFPEEHGPPPAGPAAQLRQTLAHAPDGSRFEVLVEDERLWVMRDNDRRWFCYVVDVIVARKAGA